MPAGTPEELEMLLEDACLMRNPAALGDLYEEHGAFAAGGLGPAARGRTAITQTATAWWELGGRYIADPLDIVQAGRTALIVGRCALNVALRRPDGSWQYAITVLVEHHLKEHHLKDVMSSPSDPTCRDLLSSSAERVRAGCLTVELEEAPSDDRNGT